MFTYDSVTPGSCKYTEMKTWLDHSFKTKFLQRGADGKIANLTTFYDPQLDSHMNAGIGVALVVAWYVLPQNLDLATELYEAAKQQLGWADGKVSMLPSSGSYTLNLAGLLVAQELGDTKVAKLLRDDIEHFAEPKDFGDGEFGYFFHVSESYPRGQPSAMLASAEMISQGQWRAFFQQTPEEHAARLKEPTVEGVDFPSLGVSSAFNNPNSGVLHVETYAASPSQSGQETTFSIVNLPSAAAVMVQRDGVLYKKWTASSESSIAIDTVIGEHTFAIHTKKKANSKAHVALSQTPSEQMYLVLRMRSDNPIAIP